MAEALAHAHGQGILHRDIKPSNLLLDAKGTVWVTDFGLAKAEGDDALTNTGDIVGTLRYMAPERFDGWSDPRSDVYALGATLYELLTLRPPFQESNRVKLIEQVLHESPTPLRKLDRRIPQDLETIVLKALVKEPGQRYPTAEQMAEDLRRFAADRPILARRISPAERAWRWCKRNPALAGLMAAVATLLVAVAARRNALALQYRLVASKEERLRNEAQARRKWKPGPRRSWKPAFISKASPWLNWSCRGTTSDEPRISSSRVRPACGRWEWCYLDRLCRLDPSTLPGRGRGRQRGVQPRWGTPRLRGSWRDHQHPEQRDGQSGPDFETEHRLCLFRGVPPRRQAPGLRGADRQVKVWDLTMDKEVFNCPVFSGTYTGTSYVVAFSPDGRQLAAGSEGAVKVWDWRNRQLLQTLPGHKRRRSAWRSAPTAGASRRQAGVGT